MGDPLFELQTRFKAALVSAFGAEFTDVDPLIHRSDRADYQADVALGLRKRVGGSPRDVAAKVVDNLDAAAVCDRVEIAGPGFINLWVKNEYLDQQLEDAANDQRLGVPLDDAPETVVIDYSSPNVAKELHVGNLRSTIIGDALARVLEFAGHKVIRQNHLGDWGTPFGMLIEHLVDLGHEGGGDFSIQDLNAFYQAARTKFDSDPAFAERARRRVVLLQGGDERTLALWQLLVDDSKRYLNRVYTRLGVTLGDADIAGESLYNTMLPEVAKELEEKGLARMSQGALCAFPPGFTGRDGEPQPIIVRKQDGGYGYAATDLAGVRYRTGTLQATRLAYVIGAPQSQHLAMVYAVAKMAGWLRDPVPRAEHVAFGSILGPDKKMFKTRSGETVKLIALLDEAVERALSVVRKKQEEMADSEPRLSETEQADVARAVGIGAIKYADLSSDRIKDYIFDWDRMLALDGNTAPYLQYANARIQSIFRKGNLEPAAVRTAPIRIEQPAEHALALELLPFGSVVREVSLSLNPHRLCTYLYGLATAFSRFFHECRVLQADTPEQRAARLRLCDLTSRVLTTGLGLLGIEAPARM